VIRLFVYGTLMEASDTPAARWLGPRLHSAVRASVPGRLVAIPAEQGWFPALLPSSTGRVHGLCCTAELAPRDLARLDRYEGREYRRIAARALVDAGSVGVQLYRWSRAVPPGARAIPGGDFLNWLGRRHLRAYGEGARRW
jgi:gamma-glutamylcyclotransferase (GGCT)/AIG2-like uncharacterized protein YtfP